MPPWFRSRRTRRVLLGLLIAALAAGSLYLWLTDSITALGVRDWVDSLGPAAPALFVGAFALGSLVALPVMPFVIGGRLAFGPWLGFAVGYGGGMLAVTLPFLAARLLRRHQAEPWRPRHRLAGRAFALLETHPIPAVVLLRLLLWFNAALSYALALTTLRLRDYLLACALALAPVVAAAVIATGWFL